MAHQRARLQFSMKEKYIESQLAKHLATLELQANQSATVYLFWAKALAFGGRALWGRVGPLAEVGRFAGRGRTSGLAAAIFAFLLTSHASARPGGCRVPEAFGKKQLLLLHTGFGLTRVSLCHKHGWSLKRPQVWFNKLLRLI